MGFTSELERKVNEMETLFALFFKGKNEKGTYQVNLKDVYE